MNNPEITNSVQNHPRRTEPLRARRDVQHISAGEQPISVENRRSRRHRTGKYIARLGLAAACLIPAADFATSDAITVKEYEVVTEHVDMPSPTQEHAAELGIIAALGIGESVALGQIISRNKKMDDMFNDFDDYIEQRRANMGRFRKGISKLVNYPYEVFSAVGKKFNTAGEKLSAKNSSFAKKIGRVAVEAGRVNVIGTSGVIMEETMAGKPTKLGRQVYLGSLIMGTWLAGAEAIRQLYRHVPILETPLATIGHGWETATTMDLTSPFSTPVGTAAYTAGAAMLGSVAWRVEKFREQRAALEEAYSQADTSPVE